MRDEQPLLNFKPKRKPATKGNAKKVVEDSDDDDDPAPSSRTLRAETNDSDDLEFMSVDSEGTTNGKKASKGKASTATKPVAAKKTPAARKPAARKAAPVTILIDDSDDSDDGKTFKVSFSSLFSTSFTPPCLRKRVCHTPRSSCASLSLCRSRSRLSPFRRDL